MAMRVSGLPEEAFTIGRGVLRAHGCRDHALDRGGLDRALRRPRTMPCHPASGPKNIACLDYRTKANPWVPSARKGVSVAALLGVARCSAVHSRKSVRSGV